MKTELQPLKELILTIIKKQEKPGTLALLTFEAERLPDTITANTFTLATDKQVHDYLYWQQDQLIKEANLLHKSCLDTPRLIVSKGLVIVLGILKNLKQIFPKAFDNSLTLPRTTYLKRCRLYQPIQEKLSANFKKHNIKDELAGIALYPLTWFLINTLPARYCDDCFLAKYTELLLQTKLDGLTPADAEELLCARLLTANYNGLGFMDYLTTKFKTELENSKSKTEKELVLKRMKAWLKPLPVLRDHAFDKNFPILKDALLDWVLLQEDLLALIPPDGLKKIRAQSEHTLFKLEISVAILAYFARLCKINGIYPKERKHAEILDHMVGTYCTKQTTKISRDSFYNCYKSPTTNVARALRKILRAILEDIDHFIASGVVRNEKDKP